jgi:hypothetical protein
MQTIFLYLDEDGTILFSSLNNPIKYEDQTDCIKLTLDNLHDTNRVLDLLGLK